MRAAFAKPFILGVNESVEGSAFLTTDRIYDLVGHNTGNLAFHYAISNVLGGRIPAVSWYDDVAKMNAAGDVGVLPCANQLGPHANYGSVAERFKDIKVNLVAIGLGAQGGQQYTEIPEVPEGTLEWIRQIASRAPSEHPNISVRGPFTHKVLEHYGLGRHAVVLGCPTLFINPRKDLGQQIAENAKKPFNRIAVAAGHQDWKHLARLEASLTRIMAATDGVYIAQSPKVMVALGRGEADRLSDTALAACRDYAAPELTIEQFKQWSRRYARTLLDVSAWMEYLRGFDFVIGLRIHGVMLALQAGIPALCIAHDSRTRELCETMKVPFVLAKDIAGGITRDDISRLFEFDGQNFDTNRAELAKLYRVFLGNNRLNHKVPI